MTSVGPRDPDTETMEEYLRRVVATAQPLSPEDVAELAPLLGFGSGGRHDGGDHDG